MMQYVLASASPRRKELLAECIKEFEIIPSQANEEVEGNPTPKKLVLYLAKIKAEEVAKRPENEGKIVVGSDTVVAFGDEVLGKPKDEEDAYRMLKMLSGKKHAVYTGVSFQLQKGGKYYTDTRVDKTLVYFKELSDEWIWDYIRGGSPMDKAGAYGIQDGGLVKKIKGSYTNVVGFPLELVKKMIKKAEKDWND
ncbi:MAG: septum formation protein Maf [Clostridia bacterium]|nr:septum formation protein Maf [Clostridia bacterium]